jgi:hypothetical protein
MDITLAMSKTLRALAAAIVLIVPFAARSGDDARTREFPVAAGEAYALTVSVAKPEPFAAGRVDVEVRDGPAVIVAKALHPFDLDLSTHLRPRAAGTVTVALRAVGVRLDQVDIRTDLAPLHLLKTAPVAIATAPNATWEQAQPIEPGQTVYGSADERPYVPVSTGSAYAALVSGFQWFRFTTPPGEIKLGHFVLETPDRDVPPDVDVFEPRDGGMVPYREGASAYTPEATQNYPGLSPFRTRILHPGKTYYLRVAANHPEYKLRTSLYPLPPYRDAQNSVVAGMDYLIALGDAWHANTPRRGSIALRDTMPHAEPQACIACHPTQFTVRGYVTAAKNGYPNHHPAQLRFLTERLANNPRPLYGQPDTDWARVIFSARTVASRVPVLLDMARALNDETPGNASFDSRDVTRGYADYLNLHYGNRKELAGDEADGSMPMVSAFEIGLQSWQTYGLMARDFPSEAAWRKRRDEVQEQIAARTPANVIDLGWKITALSVIDHARYRTDIDELVGQLYSWQTETGQFPYPFDHAAAPSDFITYQAMYALAAAGHRPESDSRLARTVAYALARQRPDGSWQGDPVYKGFDTPFRDTQFAVMGLSELYPYTGPKPAPAATAIRTASLDQTLADIERLPARPTAALRNEASSVLTNSPWPLARSAAAAYLGTIHDPAAIAALRTALADPAKSVQRSAAAALRRIGMNQADGVARQLAAALKSSDGRERWGALRVLAQEFRSLTSDERLLHAVENSVAQDPLPQNRFQAAGALWRWSAWRADSSNARASILNALAKPLASEQDVSVRRGLMESVYNVLDENAGQLEAWERTMADRADQEITEKAFHRAVAEQANIVASNLESGNRPLRMGLLTALWDFHLRHMAIPEDNRQKVDVILPAFFADYSAGVSRLHEPDFKYEPYAETAAFAYRATNELHVTRLGNDTDLPRLFADSGPAIERALLKCLSGADREMTMEVIKAGSVLGDAGTTAFTSAMLRLLQSPDSEIRAAVRYVYAGNQRGKLTVGSPDQPDPKIQALLADLLDSREDDVLAVALPLIADLPIGSTFTRDQKLSWSVEKILHQDNVPAFGLALRAAAVFPSIADMPLMRTEILRALASGDNDTQQAGIDLVLTRYITDVNTDELTEQFIQAMHGRERAIFIDKLDPNKYALRLSAASSYRVGLAPLPPDDNLFSSPVVQSAIVESLTSKSDLVRQAALDLVRAQPKLQAMTEIHDAIPAGSRRAQPDFDYFISKIQPILSSPGPDGKACVICHASHALFRLRIPTDHGRFTADQSQENYRNALKVINVAEPRKSLLVIKPTRPNDSVGDANLYLATHNGGERWQSNEASVEYQTILEWIRGAKLN